ncbi:restriction endonuclease subunit S [Saccharibacter sp. 17.LH.SD]|uniref:restriction endonuclease subunit S n=1 Tax=Saccharibacter sp. 17.LH.SD TaxID=2689393 RepID=UPI001368B4D7|nr:restriction endonuclease subunit S [Saccharibacter sp. 17.LH.SD]MXV44287.1 restriction endonuclease subunit S [Saccharibacter sp. 17.LH.SD]
MKGWKTRKLGDLIELKRGYDLPYSKREKGDFPIISSSGLSGYHSAYKVKGPGVIAGRYGTVGQIFFCRHPFWPLNTSLYIVDFRENFPRFCYYFLKTLDWHQFNDKSGVPGVNRNDVHQERVKFPPLAEQKEIAAVLGALDDKIENNRKTAATLEEMARALYRSWFVDFDPVHARAAGRAPAHMDAATAALFPDRFGEDGLPEGWHICHIGDELEIFDSKRRPLSKAQRLKKNGSIPYYGATSVMDYVDEFLFDEELLLLGEDGSVIQESGRPFTQYIWGPAWVNNHAHVLKGKNISIPHLKCFFDQVDISGFVNGAVQMKLNQSNLKKIPFLKASLIVQKKFDSIVTMWFQYIRSLREQSQTLTTLRDTLLPRLMSGELRVGKAKEMVEEVL